MSDRDEIIEVLARYVRALEERNAQAFAAAFAPDGEWELFGRYGRDDYVAAGVRVVGRENIRKIVENSSLPTGRGMHYMTADHIVEIAGDEATLNASFVAVESNADAPSGNDWTIAAGMVQGMLAVTMIGRYESRLRRIGGNWVFTALQVKHSLPVASSSGR